MENVISQKEIQLQSVYEKRVKTLETIIEKKIIAINELQKHNKKLEQQLDKVQENFQGSPEASLMQANYELSSGLELAQKKVKKYKEKAIKLKHHLKEKDREN